MSKRRIRTLLQFGFAALIALSLVKMDLQFLEAFTYDLRVRNKPTSPVSGNIVTIAIDPKTTSQIGREVGWSDLSELLKIVEAGGPRKIVITRNLKKMPGSQNEKLAFASIAQSLPLVIAHDDLVTPGLEDKIQLPPPLNALNVIPAPPTWDGIIFAKDGVTRRFIFDFIDKPLLHTQIAQEINGLQFKDFQGTFQFKRTKQGYIDFHPTGTYKPISFIKVLNKKIDPATFANKIVLIGNDMAAATEEYIKTPFSRDITAMSHLEMHANILDTVIQNRAPQFTPESIGLMITFLVAFMTVYIVMRISPLRGLLLLLGLGTSYILGSLLVITFAGLVIPVAQPLIAITVCYYFLIPYRLIVENRKSWEYYQRNKLLTQVEELKTNFLKMMSHDLKTPLARIQGMAEVVLRDSNQLTGHQTEALKAISQSSEELSGFIGSVLSLSRIESNEVKLHLKSKDINFLLTDVINKCDFLAQKKQIQIVTEFEPLFSLKIDEELLRQVFSNLVENAIKYSPANSKILISTEEISGQVVVQVADQGIGIRENDIPRVFDKFYRSSAVSSSATQGTGLGLYLAKYFVSLHNGNISVESQEEKGSTFTVELPMKGVDHA